MLFLWLVTTPINTEFGDISALTIVIPVKIHQIYTRISKLNVHIGYQSKVESCKLWLIFLYGTKIYRAMASYKVKLEYL